MAPGDAEREIGIHSLPALGEVRGPVAAPARCDWGAGAPRGRGAAGPPQPHLMGLSSRVPVASVQTPQLLASVQLGFRLNILEP